MKDNSPQTIDNSIVHARTEMSAFRTGHGRAGCPRSDGYYVCVPRTGGQGAHVPTREPPRQPKRLPPLLRKEGSRRPRSGVVSAF
ncbi:MAG: hypothetical protein ABL952_14125 [Pyrinomonadaceae bacterium]